MGVIFTLSLTFNILSFSRTRKIFLPFSCARLFCNFTDIPKIQKVFDIVMFPRVGKLFGPTVPGRAGALSSHKFCECVCVHGGVRVPAMNVCM